MNISWKIRRGLLALMAKSVLQRHRPVVIGITGSVGKTSTKSFINKVLETRYKTYATRYTRNTQFSVPAEIVGITKYRTVLDILRSLPKFVRTMKTKNYYRILVLEMGVFLPCQLGRIAYLAHLTKPYIGVVTGVGPAHMELFKTLENVVREKRALVESLSRNGFAILNYDNKRVREMKDFTKAKVLFYGLGKKADIRAENLRVSEEGLSFDLYHRNLFKKEIYIPGIYNKYQIYSLLAACACGTIFKIDLEETKVVLENLGMVKGRGNLVRGINEIVIINDSYNSNPASCLAALENLEELGKDRRKIAVLGDMLELGEYTEKGHRQVGKKAAEVSDLLLGVGPASRFIIDEAARHGMSKGRLGWYENSELVSKDLKKKIKANDIILVKGSHAMKMGKIVRELEMDKSK